MAVQPRDLFVSRPQQTPELSLVPPPPRRYGLASSLFVLLVAATLAIPIVGAALEEPPAFPAYRPRAIPAASITAIDRFAPLPGGRVPRSGEPIAAIAFVRCTRLWVSEPNGMNARRIVEMTGISSPAFSPDGRTIAFVRTTGGRQELWFAAADGSSVRRHDSFGLGGDPLPARVSGLAWAPAGREIAFGITDGTHGALAGGSAIWTLDLDTGKFERVDGGWPAPVWYGDQLLAARYDGAPDVQLTVVDGGRRAENEVNSSEDDLAAAIVPQGWWNNWKHSIAVLRSSGDELHLAIRTPYRRNDRLVTEAPPGYVFPRFAQPVITQDASRVAIDLLDPGAGRDLGLLDAVTGKWTIVDYAWDPSASPVPTTTGPIDARDAKSAAEMFFANVSRRTHRADMLTIGETPHDLFPWKYGGWMLGPPSRERGAWVVPALAYSYGLKDDYAYRRVDIVVRNEDSRLTATPTDPGPLVPVATIADAHTFAEIATGRELPELPALPEGTRLPGSYALNASSWAGSTIASIRTTAPGRRRDGGGRDMTFSFGEGIDFSLGCGGAVDPDPTEVAGIPAMIDRSGSTRQVVWPATPEHPTGSFSVHGTLSRDELLDLAEQVATP